MSGEVFFPKPSKKGLAEGEVLMAERADQRSLITDRNAITCSNRPIKKDIEFPAVKGVGRE